MDEEKIPVKLASDELDAKIAQYLVMGWNQRRIARRLEVSEPTVSKRVRAMHGRWKKQAAWDFDVAMGIDLERIETMISLVWPKVVDPKGRSQVSAIRVVKELLERKAKMLGYDQPEKIQQAIGIMDARELPMLDVSQWSLQEQAALDGLLTNGTLLAAPDWATGDAQGALRAAHSDAKSMQSWVSLGMPGSLII